MTSWFAEKDIPAEFPVLDMQALMSGELADFSHLISSSGLFYLKNFGVKEADLEKFVEITGFFFNETEEIKKKMICSGLPLRGYTSLKSENLAKLLKVGDYPDLCMKYSWATAGNTAPSAEFEIIWQKIFNEMNEVSKNILSLIATLLKNEPQISSDDWKKIINGESMLRHLFYPDLQEIQPLSMAPHSDLGSITLLYQTPANNRHVALEAEYNGNYLPLPAVKGTIVVNFGDILEHITKKKIKATKHRVVHCPQAGSARTSTVFFSLPQRDFDLTKFKGSSFSGLLSKEIETFGDLLDWDAEVYSNKRIPE